MMQQLTWGPCMAHYYGAVRDTLLSGPLAELKSRAQAAFRHEMKYLRENEDQLRSQSMLSKFQRGECNDFWK